MTEQIPTPEQLQQDPYFHIFLLKYYFNYTTKKERTSQDNEDYLHFEFGDNTYTIKYGDLKRIADEEYLRWKENQPKATIKDDKFEYILKKI